MGLLFISQSQLEGWVEKGEVTFEDNLLTLPSQNASYQLEPALSVKTVLDGEDQQGLVGRVLSVEKLKQMGGEHFSTSLILGETAYECDEGFVGIEAAGSHSAAPEATLQPSHGAAPADASDSQLLEDFLLKNLC